MAVRCVVAGAGGISNAWFPPLAAEGVEVAAVVDLRPTAAEAQVARYNLTAEVSDDLRAMIARHQPDFVLDLTVPEAHHDVTLTALAAGCHVLGEKPLAATLAEAREMVAAAAAADRLYMVSQSRRWDTAHERIRRTVASGRLGQLTTVCCDFFLGAHFGGFRDAMNSPLILDMAIHHFDLARFFTGADPLAVYALEYNPVGSWYTGAPAASAIFELSDSLIFTYRGSWCAEGCRTSWNGDWRIIGERGTLVYAGDTEPWGEVLAPDPGDGFDRRLVPLEVEPAVVEHTTMHGALREMLAFLAGGPRPATEAADNIHSLAMVFGALDSARRAARVELTV